MQAGRLMLGNSWTHPNSFADYRGEGGASEQEHWEVMAPEASGPRGCLVSRAFYICLPSFLCRPVDFNEEGRGVAWDPPQSNMEDFGFIPQGSKQQEVQTGKESRVSISK